MNTLSLFSQIANYPTLQNSKKTIENYTLDFQNLVFSFLKSSNFSKDFPEQLKFIANFCVNLSKQLEIAGIADYSKRYLQLSAYFFQLSNSFKNALLDNKVNNAYKIIDDLKNIGDISFNSPNLKSLYIRNVLQYLYTENKKLRYILACKSYVLKNRFAVGIVYKDIEDKKTYHWNNCHLCHCRNVWLCPDCRRFILGGRCREINKAYTKWIAQGGKVFMLTLTISHTATSSAVDLVQGLKDCYVKLRNSCVWREMWRFCDSPTGKNAMIGNYEFTFGKTGIHPHRHVLFFVKKSPAAYWDRLRKTWVRLCVKSGFKASEKAQDLQEIKSSAEYISKIGWELCDSSLKKEGRLNGRLSFAELCEIACNGEDWALNQVRDYIKASHNLLALHWSKGLKDYFEVKNLDDDEIIKAETMKYKRFGYISRDSFSKINEEKRTALLCQLDSTQGVIDFNFKTILEALQIDFYNTNGDKIIDCGSDSQRMQQLISSDAYKDYMQILEAEKIVKRIYLKKKEDKERQRE